MNKICLRKTILPTGHDVVLYPFMGLAENTAIDMSTAMNERIYVCKITNYPVHNHVEGKYFIITDSEWTTPLLDFSTIIQARPDYSIWEKLKFLMLAYLAREENV